MPRRTRRTPRTKTRSPQVEPHSATISRKVKVEIVSPDTYEVITDESDVPITDEHGLTLVV